MARAVVLALVLAFFTGGCVTVLDDGTTGSALPTLGADGWEPPGEAAPSRAVKGEACLETTVTLVTEVARPGTPFLVEARVTNCGAMPLTVSRECRSPIPHVFLTWRGHWWILGVLDGGNATSATRTSDRGEVPSCPFALPPDRLSHEDHSADAWPDAALAPGENLTTTVTWRGFVAVDTCGDGRFWHGGTAPAAPGGHQVVVVARTDDGLEAAARTMVRVTHEDAHFFPHGNRTVRNIATSGSMGGAHEPRGFEVFETREGLTEVCHGPSPLGEPFLDLDRERLLLVRGGEGGSSCHQVHVTDLAVENGVTVATVGVYDGGTRTPCLAVVQWPFQLVAIPHDGSDVEVRWVTRHAPAPQPW